MAQKIDNEVTVPLNQNDDEVDDVQHASDIYGEWGSLQRNVTIYFIMIYIVASFQNIGVVFYLSPIDYHCQLPAGFEDRNVSKCFTFEGSTEKCTKWQFDNSFYKKTLIDEFELVCDREHYISMTKSIFQFGFLVASIITGWMSDKYGRLFTFQFAIILEIVASLSQALSVNILHFIVSRFFLGMGSYGRFSTGMLLLLELVGPSNRATINILSELGWCLSTLFLPVAHYILPHFRYMQLAVFGYELIFLIWLWQLPESPRWLITHNRFDEAASLIRKTAKSLKRLSDTEIETKLEKLRRYTETKQLNSETKKTIFDLWSQPTLFRYCALLYVMHFCVTYISYSFSYNASSYGASIHVTIFVQGLSKTCIFLTVYFLVNRFARKSLLMFFGICAACSTLAMLPFVFETTHLNYLTAVMFAVKFFCFGLFLLNQLVRVEIFPTVLRRISIGSCSVAMRFGSMLSPYSQELANLTHLSVVIGLYGILAVVNVACIYFLPETSGGEIPDTIKEALQRYDNKNAQKTRKDNETFSESERL